MHPRWRAESAERGRIALVEERGQGVPAACPWCDPDHAVRLGPAVRSLVCDGHFRSLLREAEEAARGRAG